MHRIDLYKLSKDQNNKKKSIVKSRKKPSKGERQPIKPRKFREARLSSIDKKLNRNKKHCNQNKSGHSIIISNLWVELPITDQSTILKLFYTTLISLSQQTLQIQKMPYRKLSNTITGKNKNQLIEKLDNRKIEDSLNKGERKLQRNWPQRKSTNNI